MIGGRTSTSGVGRRQPDGSPSAAAEISGAYRAMCSCGWVGPTDHPASELGGWSAASEWGTHLAPILAATPPDWLLNRAKGSSWAQIGTALGVTKQSAHERFRGAGPRGQN